MFYCISRIYINCCRRSHDYTVVILRSERNECNPPANIARRHTTASRKLRPEKLRSLSPFLFLSLSLSLSLFLPSFFSRSLARYRAENSRIKIARCAERDHIDSRSLPFENAKTPSEILSSITNANGERRESSQF